jgi:hypothetical protein
MIRPSALRTAPRDAEFAKFGDDGFPVRGRAHLVINIEDAPIDADIERPARRERLIGIDHAVRPRDAARRIAQERIINTQGLRERFVRFRRIDTRREIRDVERPNLLATLTE